MGIFKFGSKVANIYLHNTLCEGNVLLCIQFKMMSLAGDWKTPSLEKKGVRFTVRPYGTKENAKRRGGGSKAETFQTNEFYFFLFFP